MSSNDWKDADFASEVVGARMERANPAAGITIFVVLAFFVAAAIWADTAVIDEVTRGEGKVIPSSQVQVVQNLEGGIVQDILVNEGQIVDKGTLLIRIDDTGFSSSFGELRATSYATRARIARLEAEVSEKPLNFPPDLLAEARDIARNEQELMQSRRETLTHQVSILQEQVQQRQQEITEARARLGQLRRSLGLLNQEIDMTRPLMENGVVPKVDFLRLERESNDIKGEIQANELAVPRIQAALQEARKRVEEKFLEFRTEARQELTTARAEFSAMEENLRGARDRVTRTEVVSPVKGVVKTLHVRTIGGVIKPGQDIVEIVPLDDTLLVQARIRPQDVAFLSPGQKVTVKFTAYDFSIYGGLDGALERISADTILDQQSKETYYEIIVRTDRNFLEHKQQKLPLMPGMVTTVDILTGERTILDYLMKPFLKARRLALTER